MLKLLLILLAFGFCASHSQIYPYIKNVDCSDLDTEQICEYDCTCVWNNGTCIAANKDNYNETSHCQVMGLVFGIIIGAVIMGVFLVTTMCFCYGIRKRCMDNYSRNVPGSDYYSLHTT